MDIKTVSPADTVSNVSGKPIVRQLEENKTMKKTVNIVFAVMILLGVATGYMLTTKLKGGPGGTDGSVATDKVVGSTDAKTFKDSADGMIEKGGLEGEGTHHLIREGGPSKTVYLISSVIDLDLFIGKKVVVWGQTQAAEKAAWLMDVGKVELE